MTDSKTINKLLSELPEQVQEYIFDESFGDLNIKITENNRLSDDERPILFGLIKELFVNTVKPEELLAETKKRFRFDDERAKKLALDIAGHLLLPLDKFLGDIVGLVRSLGGDPGAYSDLRIRIETRTEEQAIDEIVESVKIENISHRLNGRLHDVVSSYLAGVRTDSQLYEILTRPEKTGGVALKPVDASLLVDEAREEKMSVVIQDKSKPEKEDTSTEQPPVPEAETDTNETATPPASEKKTDTFATILPEDEEEIEQIKKKLPVEAVAKAEGTDQKIRKSVDDIFQAVGIVPPNEELQNRFKKIIENRLRDVRDQLETLEVLSQPKELGGMSFSQDDARRVLSLIENKLKNVHSMHEKAVTAEKRKWVASTAVASVKRAHDEKKAEELKRDEAFHSVVAKSAKAQKVVGGMPPKPVPVPAPPLGVPPPKLPVIPAAKPPVPAPHVAPAPKPVPPPKPPATIVRPLVKPPLPQKVFGSQVSERPKIQDVKFTPKLTGPFEEIRKTSLEDFRRLSKDPKEATLKIKDKIDLQGEESFDNKMKAIQAWNTSDVYRLYLEMMKEALEGKPMEQVIASRNEAKKPALTQEEMRAIVQLGTQLRY